MVWLNAWPHVQRARDVGRRQLDGKRGLARLGRAGAPKTRRAVATALPLGAPVGLQGGGFEGLGEAVEAGLCSGVAHGGIAIENGIP